MNISQLRNIRPTILWYTKGTVVERQGDGGGRGGEGGRPRVRKLLAQPSELFGRVLRELHRGHRAR